MSIIATVQTLTPGAIVHMFEIEKADGTYVYFSGYFSYLDHNLHDNRPI